MKVSEDTPTPEQESTDICKAFRPRLEKLLNTHCMENASDTPDFILAEYLSSCLDAFDAAVRRRDEWYDRRIPRELGLFPPS